MKTSQKLNFSAIVLAAGEGKRMKSPLSKVLHKIAGMSMLERTLGILRKVNPIEIIVVVNPKNSSKVKTFLQGQKVAVQNEAIGTADAASAGLIKSQKNISTVAVLYGDDSAFYKPETVAKVFNHHLRSKATITFATVLKENPFGLGRIVRKNGKLIGIVEENDASEDQKKIKEINDGLYFFERDFLEGSLMKLKPSPVTGELYLTDLISLALKSNHKVETYLVGENQWHGINTPEELRVANIKLGKRIHFMGIGGAGASAVARISKSYGFKVTGCDQSQKSAYLKNYNGVKIGHNASHLKDINTLVVSPALLKFDSNNSEIKKAKDLKIPILTWQEFQGKILQQDKFVIAVAGTYGKSTTTAMISKILIDQNLDPTCEVGAKVIEWGTNFRVGKSKYYICEADEYNNNFLNYQPDIAIILNFGWDHPDFFPNKESVIDSYEKFIAKIKPSGSIIIPDTRNAIPAKRLRGDLKIFRMQDSPKLKLKIIGDFRKENADAALTVANCLGLDTSIAYKSIENFKGLARRLEYKGRLGKTKFYDDYAVQPYTIEKTANALKAKFKNQKVTLVFEPHTFSRINMFFEDFVKTLKKMNVDNILITEVYPAREKGDKEKLARHLQHQVGSKSSYTGSVEKTAKFIKKNLKDFRVICSMGAGNSYRLWDLIRK